MNSEAEPEVNSAFAENAQCSDFSDPRRSVFSASLELSDGFHVSFSALSVILSHVSPFLHLFCSHPLQSLQHFAVQTDDAFLNYEHHVQQSLLCDYVDLATNPTYVILDSGCTRAMGSRLAIDRLVKACKQHKNNQSKFSFANGESSTVTERLVIHLQKDKVSTGWISTSVDILDKGRAPILFSVEQMRNLHMYIEHTPIGEFLTCIMFGMKRTALAVSASNHPVLDVMALAQARSKPEHSFHVFATSCPARNGKHRAHTYKDGCKKKKVEPKSDPRPAKTSSKKTSKRKVEVPDVDKKVVPAEKSSERSIPRAEEPPREEDDIWHPNFRMPASEDSPLPEDVPPSRSAEKDQIGASEFPDMDEYSADDLGDRVAQKEEVKEEEKVKAKKQPGPRMNLPLAIR